MPAERAEALLELADRDDLVGRLVRLQLVAVDDDGEARQPLVRRGLQPLVVLALLQLAVTEHDDDPAATSEVALRPGDPPPLRNAHSERARVRLDSGHAHVRMPVEPTQPTQPREALLRDDPERVQRRVQARDVVPLRREVDVPVGRVPADRRGVQLLEEEERDHVHCAERRAEVARTGALHGNERVQPAGVGEDAKPHVRIQRGRTNTLDLRPGKHHEYLHSRGRR